MKDLFEQSFNRLLKITKKLRSEEGCPWDRKQNFESLKSHIIEESYEVLEAIDSKNYQNLKEEIGDLLLQILFISNIAEERTLFSLEDAVNDLSEKLIRRHPHVFDNEMAKTPNEAKDIWDRQKIKEGKIQKREFSKSSPSLIRAMDISNTFAKSGLEWDSSEKVLEVLLDEIKEFKSAVKKMDQLLIEEEIGDILFTVANLSRKKNINPEIALNKSLDKFLKRAVLFIDLRKKFIDLSDEEIWERAKLILKESL